MGLCKNCGGSLFVQVDGLQPRDKGETWKVMDRVTRPNVWICFWVLRSGLRGCGTLSMKREDWCGNVRRGVLIGLTRNADGFVRVENVKRVEEHWRSWPFEITVHCGVFQRYAVQLPYNRAKQAGIKLSMVPRWKEAVIPGLHEFQSWKYSAGSNPETICNLLAPIEEIMSLVESLGSRHGWLCVHLKK